MKFYSLLILSFVFLSACGNTAPEPDNNGNNDSDNAPSLNSAAEVTEAGKVVFEKYIRGIHKERELKANYVSGDVNGDGKLDLLVDYCMVPTQEDLVVEGGGNALAGMRCMFEGFTLYLNTGESLVKKLDIAKPEEVTEMYMDAVKIEDGHLICTAKTFGPDDGRFPTVDKDIYFKFDGDDFDRLADTEGNENDQ